MGDTAPRAIRADAAGPPVDDALDGRALPRIAVVSRGDPLTSYLHAALAARYPVVADVDVELHGVRRAAVAAATVRPTRPRWAQSYIHSNAGYWARSALARHRLAACRRDVDIVLQTHALFDCGPYPTMIYIDCTYWQAIRGWPDWTLARERSRAVWLRRETAAYRRARHLFAFNDDTRASLIEDYGIAAERITVVGAGVNFDTLAARPAARPDHPPTVLFVGKEFDRKGGPELLRSFAQVRRAVPDARLQIVGTDVAGPSQDGVDVLGLVSDRDRLAQLYADADLFCLPSHFDPGAIVVLEAMAHGVPCVVSRDASQLVHDLVDDRSGGVLIETGDEAGLVTAMTEMLRQPATAARMAEHAQRRVLDDRLWTHVVQRMAPALEAAVRLQPTVS